MRLLVFVAFVAVATAPSAFAADAARPPGQAASAQPPQVPGDDIFGFTTQTDTGNVGEWNFALETSSGIGKRFGRYWTTSLKNELSVTPVENVFWAFSPFVTTTHSRGVPGITDIDRTDFDGLSTEVLWRFMPRNEQGFAATLSVEPRWMRLDGTTGQSVTALSAEFKLFVDAVIIPDKLFWAFNLNYQPNTQKLAGPGNPWVNGTATNVSTALSYQISPSMFIGAELRYEGNFDGAFMNRVLGTALFAGPVFLVKPSEKSFLNVSWTPQLIGWGRNDPSNLDLVNFPRHQLRVKYSVTF